MSPTAVSAVSGCSSASKTSLMETFALLRSVEDHRADSIGVAVLNEQ
jgi:hypothetical protein